MDPLRFNPPQSAATLGALPHSIAAATSHHILPAPIPDVINGTNVTQQMMGVASKGGSTRKKQTRPQKLMITPDTNLEAGVGVGVEALSEANGVPVAILVAPEKRVVLGGPSGEPNGSGGRPAKSRLVADVNDVGRSNKSIAAVGVKRRRKPRKTQGSGQMPIVQSRIGLCPDNVGSRVLGPTEPQWMVDYAQVRAKLDSMQSKMRNAIGVLKPYLIAKGHLSTALNELNQISTMDIMTVSLYAPGTDPQPAPGPHFY